MTSSFNNLNVPDVKRDPELPIKSERLNGFAEEDTMSSSRNHEQQCCLLDNGKRYLYKDIKLKLGFRVFFFT